MEPILPLWIFIAFAVFWVSILLFALVAMIVAKNRRRLRDLT